MALPPKAEYKLGFHHWFERLQGIARDTGLPLIIYANNEIIQKLKPGNIGESVPLNILFYEFANGEEFLIFSREIKKTICSLLFRPGGGICRTLHNWKNYFTSLQVFSGITALLSFTPSS